jgi:4'-phosphopantetheinyl transferase
MSAPSTPAGDSLSVWWAQLDVPSPALADLSTTLSPQERRRADQHGRRLDRDRFLAARGWLRRLLGQQLRCPPQEVAILSRRSA